MDEQIQVDIPSDIVPSYSEAADQSDPNPTAHEGVVDHAAIEFSLADEDAVLTPLGQGDCSYSYYFLLTINKRYVTNYRNSYERSGRGRNRRRPAHQQRRLHGGCRTRVPFHGGLTRVC